jgi:peptidyl-prolyl cis-trans isomerase SurA
MKIPLKDLNHPANQGIISQKLVPWAASGHERSPSAPSAGGRRSAVTVALLSAVIAAYLALLPACRRQAKTGGEVWAEVDGQPIVRDEVERVYNGRKAAGNNPADTEEALSFKLSILNELINNQILVAHALESGITVSEAEVDTKIAQVESPYSQAEFEQKLKENGMDRADLRREIKTQLLISKLINRDIDVHVSVSKDEMQAYYKQNEASFNVPETEYQLAQIEVTPGADSEIRNLKNDDAKNPAVAEHKIQALYAELQRGADFAALARNYSEDPRSAPNGGDMGYVPISTLNSSPQLKRVVLSLKPGQISGIIRTSSGYHIVKLLGIVKAGRSDFSDPQVQATIRKTLTNEKEQLLKTAFIEVLRDRAKVQNFLAQKIVKQDGEPK